ncbi:MAG: hypothetical protein QNJ33_10605 [Crocosphaera sp.]|nr:hypothetical protein [Crocosphaera sp.]
MSNLSRNHRFTELNQALGKTDTPKINQSSQKLDVTLTFDITGSMYSYLEKVRQELNYLSQEIKQAISQSKIGVIAYGDYCDAQTTYVTKVLNLSDNYQLKEQLCS